MVVAEEPMVVLVAMGADPNVKLVMPPLSALVEVVVEGRGASQSFWPEKIAS